MDVQSDFPGLGVYMDQTLHVDTCPITIASRWSSSLPGTIMYSSRNDRYHLGVHIALDIHSTLDNETQNKFNSSTT